MKIVLLHYSAPPVAGGVEAALEQQALQLVRAGHQVRIVTGRGETWDARIPVEVLNRLEPRFPANLRAKAGLDAGQVSPEFGELVELTQTDLQRALSGADVVIAHNVASMNKNLVLTVALYNLWLIGAMPNLILWHHDLAWTTPRYAEELHPGYPWDLLRTPWPGASQVTVSEVRRQELADLMQIPLDQITVVPVGLDMQQFLSLQPRTVALMDQLNLWQATPILLTPVRLNKRKNLDLALQTLSFLRRDFPRAAIVVAGPGGTQASDEYLDRLKKLRSSLALEDSAHLLAEFAPDGLPEAELASLYRVADALFLPSKEEGFGLPVLEAGLARLPIFCSDLPALRDLAGHYATYFDVDEEPKAIARLMAHQFKNDAQYRLRTRVRQQFTWSAIYHSLIAPLLEQK